MVLLFSCLILLQFVVIVSHDWIDVPGWMSGSQVQAVVGRRRLLIASLLKAVFPGAAVALAIVYWRAVAPPLAQDYWIVYCAITVLSAIFMWYVPYLFSTNDQTKDEYARMYAGTHHVLPPRGDNPRPNLLHLCFHVLFVVNLLLAILIRANR